MSLLLNQVSIQGYSSSANSYPIKKRMSLGSRCWLVALTDKRKLSNAFLFLIYKLIDILTLVSDTLRAIAEYSRNDRTEFIHTVQETQVAQQSADIAKKFFGES